MRHDNTLLFVERVLGHIQLYRERQRGGGGGRQTNHIIRTFGYRIIGGGAVFYWATPLPPSAFQVLPSSQSGIEVSGIG